MALEARVGLREDALVPMAIRDGVRAILALLDGVPAVSIDSARPRMSSAYGTAQHYGRKPEPSTRAVAVKNFWPAMFARRCRLSLGIRRG
jgi:hypothetical protein